MFKLEIMSRKYKNHWYYEKTRNSEFWIDFESGKIYVENYDYNVYII